MKFKKNSSNPCGFTLNGFHSSQKWGIVYVLHMNKSENICMLLHFELYISLNTSHRRGSGLGMWATHFTIEHESVWGEGEVSSM